MLCVPAKVQWQCMLLCGWDQLDVTFEDVDTFAKVPMNFRFASLKPFGRSWLPLDNAMLRNKLKWVSMAKQLEYRCECTDEGKCGYCEDNIQELVYEEFPGKLWEGMRCTCGACVNCLSSIGFV